MKSADEKLSDFCFGKVCLFLDILSGPFLFSEGFAMLSFPKLKWVDEKLSKVNQANKAEGEYSEWRKSFKIIPKKGKLSPKKEEHVF